MGLSSRGSLHDHPRHALVERWFERAELALGWLRSAEPGFGEPGRSVTIGRQFGNRSLKASRLRRRESPQVIEHGGRITGSRPLHEPARLPLQLVHAWVGVSPPVDEACLIEAAQVWLDRRAGQ